LEEFVQQAGTFPIEAFIFLNEGLAYTAHAVHGKRQHAEQDRHVSGQQLCEGLRDFAFQKYGMLAGTVLQHWGITSTRDFGAMVYSLIAAGMMGKSESDSQEDFCEVYDFRCTFDAKNYRIPKLK